MSITIYSKQACIQCTATYRAMDQRGIDYQVIDIEQDEEALNRLRDMGYRQVPVIVTSNDHWSGFRPDKISTLTNVVAS